MKEVLLYGAKDMRLVDSPIPSCGPTNILIKLQACAICPTDLRKYRLGKMGSPLIRLPMNMGHEWTGDVVEVGEYVDYPKVGMRVRGFGFVGYAEYALLDILTPAKRGRRIEDTLVELPENVSYLEGTFLENVGVGIHSLVDQAGGSLGKTIVIIGAGQMGLTHILLAKLIGAKTIVTEMIDWRLDLAEKYGADYVVNPSKEDPVEAVKRITKGKMADGVVITVGIEPAIIQGINMLGRYGSAVLFGGATLDTTITFNPNLIHYGDRALVGCSGGPQRGQLAMELLASGKVPVKEMITHKFKLEELPEAFEKITENKLERYLKGLVTY
jgi:L-iditol 2-dehydrogenase